MKPICCWWCCHPFEGEPLKLPHKCDVTTGKFTTCGNFCSWSCMKAYALGRYGSSNSSSVVHNIHKYRKAMTAEKVSSIIPVAPSRYALEMFGGPLSIEEFRKSGTGDVKIIVNIPDQIHSIVTIHNCTCGGNVMDLSKVKNMEKTTTVNNINKERLNDEKMSMINMTNSKNEPLRLKRPKPLKRDENNLEKTLGLIRKKK